MQKGLEVTAWGRARGSHCLVWTKDREWVLMPERGVTRELTPLKTAQPPTDREWAVRPPGPEGQACVVSALMRSANRTAAPASSEQGGQSQSQLWG